MGHHVMLAQHGARQTVTTVKIRSAVLVAMTLRISSSIAASIGYVMIRLYKVAPLTQADE